MKILHICQRDDPSIGGSLRVAEALVMAQRKAGHDVWMLFLYGPPGEIALKARDSTICLELVSSRKAFIGVYFLRRSIRGLMPDIIHLHDGIIWPRIALLNLSISRIMHSHLPANPRRNLKDQLGWILIRRSTDWVIGISKHTSMTWIDAGYPISQLSHVPNGVDFDRFDTASPEDKTALRSKLDLPVNKKLLLWVGRIHQGMKGSDRVERLAHILPKGVVMVVVGEGPDAAGMRTRCAGLLSSGSMIMAGSVQYPEQYYRSADAFLFTSYHEPFGLVILEAVASGLPILSFPVTGGGGAVELLKEFNAVEIHDNDSDKQIAAVVERVLDDVPKGDQLRASALQRYSWEGISQIIVDVYNELRTPTKKTGLRVLHICQRDDLSSGGATRIAFDLAKGQRRVGVDAHIVFLYGKSGSMGWELLSGKCAHYLGLNTAAEVVWKWRSLFRLLRVLKPDVVHHHDMLTWPQMVHVFSHRYRLIYHAHLDYRRPRGLKSTLAWHMIINNTRVIITPSAYGRSQFLENQSSRFDAERVRIVPNGTSITDNSRKRPLRRISSYYSDGSVVLGWAGRLHCGAKGTDDFIRLFMHLPPKFCGVIVGQGPDESALRKLVSELGFEDRIQFFGLVQNMDSFYERIDAFVMSSHFESFGLVVIEALAHRVPVFSLPAQGGINDLYSLPGVHRIAARNLVDLARAIQQGLMDVDQLAVEMELAVKAIKEHYSIDRMVEETVRLYNEM